MFWIHEFLEIFIPLMGVILKNLDSQESLEDFRKT